MIRDGLVSDDSYNTDWLTMEIYYTEMNVQPEVESN